jgi:serine/threonine-protein kinase RsbW/stage II sporulation protein AB (anti-sigma F factor)
MAEDHTAGARYGPYSRTLEDIRAEQGRIRAASARQRTRAFGMRDEAVELRAQRRPVHWFEDHRRSASGLREMTAARSCDLGRDDHGPLPGERLKATAAARAEAVGELRRELNRFAQRIGASEIALEALALAASEALTNVAVHAYADGQPGPMTMEAWHNGDGHLVVLVSDEGKGMVPRVNSPGMGMGIPLMAQMADEVHVVRRDDLPGTLVSVRFSLDGSGVRLPSDDDS